MLPLLTLEPSSMLHRIYDHHALGESVANDAETRVGQHPLQRRHLPAPIPVPALRPTGSLYASPPQSLHRPEQLRHPLSFPIRQLLLGYRVPKFCGHWLAARNVQQMNLSDRHRHSIMTSALSFVTPFSKSSLSPLSRRASIT